MDIYLCSTNKGSNNILYCVGLTLHSLFLLDQRHAFRATFSGAATHAFVHCALNF